MYVHEVQVRVRYGETDQMGYLYYGNYAQYYEVGRVEMIRSMGLTYKDMEETHGIWMPVVELQTKYLRPIFYDNLVTVRTELRELPDRFVTFYVQLLNEEGKVCTTGEVKLCFFHGTEKKVVSAPEYFLKEIRPYFSA
jgi:acyl-CoA thioester hydrolase